MTGRRRRSVAAIWGALLVALCLGGPLAGEALADNSAPVAPVAPASPPSYQLLVDAASTTINVPLTLAADVDPSTVVPTLEGVRLNSNLSSALDKFFTVARSDNADAPALVISVTFDRTPVHAQATAASVLDRMKKLEKVTVAVDAS